MDVHARGKEHVHAVFVDFISHRGGHFFHEGGVPGAGEQRTHGEAGAVEGLARPLAGRLDAQAGRAVGQHSPGDAETLDGPGVAGRAGHLGGDAGGDAVHDLGAGATHQEGGFFFKGHGGKDLVDVVLAELRLRQGGDARQQQRGNDKGFLHIGIVGVIY